MKKNQRAPFVTIVLLITCLLASGIAYGGENMSLKGLESVKCVFDFRTGNPKTAITYLNLINDTLMDRDISKVTEKPDFVVDFGGASVKLLSTEMKGFSPEEQKLVNDVRDKISDLAKKGVKFEFCIYAANLFGLKPADLPDVTVIDNGWVSLIGYQGKGYAIITAF